jgi:hypothetical protein
MMHSRALSVTKHTTTLSRIPSDSQTEQTVSALRSLGRQVNGGTRRAVCIRSWWLTDVIPATQEAEIRKIEV